MTLVESSTPVNSSIYTSLTSPPQQDTIEKPQTYEIHDIRRSENALLLFNNKYVFKLLRSYKDCRYSQTELSERQNCLKEGWRWNRLFTRGIHLGLARLYDYEREPDRPSPIKLGKFLNPDLEPLDKNAEYVLVMRKLPKASRLDVLLKDGGSDSQKNYGKILTEFLAHVHASTAFPPAEPDENRPWGSTTQLKEKLENNLASVENPDVTNTKVLKTASYQSLKDVCKVLRETLLPIFTDNKYKDFQQYFAQRVKKQHIQRCHGDLKTRNIWIMPSPTPNPDSPNSYLLEIWSGVRVLDAIDFNSDFCNIDTLSDFAMLVADIHTRADSQELANLMIEDYLSQTKQQDKGSRFVLNYYLVEKAFVGALVSILYDAAPRLGLAYLKVISYYLGNIRYQLSIK